MVSQIPFSSEPVIDVATILPTTHFIEMVREPGDLIRRWTVATVGNPRRHAFAPEIWRDVGIHHRFTSIVWR
jgi:hypothetical protein